VGQLKTELKWPNHCCATLPPGSRLQAAKRYIRKKPWTSFAGMAPGGCEGAARRLDSRLLPGVN